MANPLISSLPKYPRTEKNYPAEGNDKKKYLILLFLLHLHFMPHESLLRRHFMCIFLASPFRLSSPPLPLFYFTILFIIQHAVHMYLYTVTLRPGTFCSGLQFFLQTYKLKVSKFLISNCPMLVLSRMNFSQLVLSPINC